MDGSIYNHAWIGIVAFNYQALKFINVHVTAKNFFLNIHSVKKHSYCDQNFQLYIVQIIYINIDCKMCW